MDIRNGKIIMPTIYVPTWTEMYTQAGVGLRGEMEWELFERHNGKEVMVRRGKQRNLIVDAGIDSWFLAWGIDSLHVIAKSYIAVGTGVMEPEKSQTQLISQLDARKLRTFNSGGDAFSTYVFELDEAMANGDLTEWGLFSKTAGGTMWCRELFRDENGDPVVVTKTNTQVLRFTYTLHYQRVADSSTAIITADGVEYTCVTTINNKQMRNIAQRTLMQLYSNSASIKLGTSNAASDLINDQGDTLKGSLIQKLTGSQAPYEKSDYVSGAFRRSETREIGGSYGNGDIGEALFATWISYAGAADGDHTYSCRVTFDPAIPKTTSKKLYLGVEWSLAGV